MQIALGQVTNISGSGDKRKDTLIWAKRQAIGKMDLSFGARECWRILEGFPTGRCYPSHYFIAETMRKSKSAVCRYLRELKERGYIDIDKRSDRRGQTSNGYIILDQPDLIARANQIFQEWAAKNV
jgi:hypothetical protein